MRRVGGWFRTWACVECGWLSGVRGGLWGAGPVCPKCGHRYGAFGPWKEVVVREIREGSWRKPWTWSAWLERKGEDDDD